MKRHKKYYLILTDTYQPMREKGFVAVVKIMNIIIVFISSAVCLSSLLQIGG